MAKRQISLGLDTRPEADDDDKIYVNFMSVSKGICGGYNVRAYAFSGQDFRYNVLDRQGNIVSETGVNASTKIEFDEKYIGERPYRQFLEELVSLNDAEICFQRMISDWVFTDSVIRETMKQIKNLHFDKG
jgi:hypothetical protein